MAASLTGAGSTRLRNNPFSRDSASPSPVPPPRSERPKSMNFASSPANSSHVGHSRNQSFSPLSGANLAPARTTRERSNSTRNSAQTSNTFAPKFIKTEELSQGQERIDGIEGENDFSGKRYVWIKDAAVAFVKGWIVEGSDGGQYLIQCEDGSVRISVSSPRNGLFTNEL